MSLLNRNQGRFRSKRIRKFQDIDEQYARIEFVCRPDQKANYQLRADAEKVSLSAWLVSVADKAVGEGRV